MITHSFKAGNSVPDWVMKGRNLDLKFGCDVDVELTRHEAVHLYPRVEGNGPLIIGTLVDPSAGGGSISGSTHCFAYPCRDARNDIALDQAFGDFFCQRSFACSDGSSA